MSLLSAHTNTHIPDGVRRIRSSTWPEYRTLLNTDYYAIRTHLLHVDSHSREYARLVGRVAHKEDYDYYDDKSAPSHSGYSPPNDTPLNT